MHIVTTDADGPTVFFLHGYLDSWRTFERVFPHLGSNLRLVAPDQRGHGASDEAADYSIAGFVTDAIEVIRAMGANPVHLVGHSLGAIIALRIARESPELLSSIVLIGGAVTAAQNPALLEFSRLIDDLADPVPYELAYEFQKGTAFQALAPSDLDVYVGESLKVKARAWKGALGGLIDDPYRPGPPATFCPALIVWGAHDQLFPEHDQFHLRQYVPHAEVIDYPDFGHAPQWESPGTVAADLNRFIDRIEREPSRRRG